MLATKPTWKERKTMPHPESTIPTREEAIQSFRALVSRHGLRWDARVPESAHAELARVNTVLTARDRIEAIMPGRAR